MKQPHVQGAESAPQSTKGPRVTSPAARQTHKSTDGEAGAASAASVALLSPPLRAPREAASRTPTPPRADTGAEGQAGHLRVKAPPPRDPRQTLVHHLLLVFWPLLRGSLSFTDQSPFVFYFFFWGCTVRHEAS